MSAALMVLAFSTFIETLERKKITRVTLVYAIFSIFFALTQIFFCAQYGEEMIGIWNVIFPIYFTYVLFYDIFYCFYWDKNGQRRKKSDWLSDLPIINILTASTLLIYICALYDVFVAVFLKNSTNNFLYGTFVVQIGMAFALAMRFSGMYKRLEQSNLFLENAVRERTVELEKQTMIAVEASKAKSQFLATMSHEIRTPLNAIIGLSEIMLHRDKLQSESRNDIYQIHQSGSSLLGIINDVLDISKIEAGGFELILSEYETAPFINETVSLNRVRIGSKPVSFTLEINGDFPGKLLGDELRVKQVLNNLLSNAVKYTREGHIILTASWEYIQTAHKELKLTFKVSDTGIGIRREDMGKLFSNYTQLDAKVNRVIEGTGLGLVITKNLVEMMGGAITVESEYGKGSVFTVTLVQNIPMVSGHDVMQHIGNEIAESLKSFKYVSHVTEKKIDYSRIPRGKVLVVDDMPVNLQVAKGLLEPYGLEVDTAASGQEAIEKVKAAGSHYNLVFMDYMMPVMDGIEAVRIIRAWELEKGSPNEETRIPIIALTANALVGNKEMFMSLGFNGFIAKPIDVVQLDETLEKWVKVKISREMMNNDLTPVQSGDAEELSISGINVKRGIAFTGGNMEIYCDILSTFCEDVQERLPFLNTVPNESNLRDFITLVHALKSAASSISAEEVAALAAELETSGKAGNLIHMAEKLPVLTARLSELVGNIRASLGTTK